MEIRRLSLATGSPIKMMTVFKRNGIFFLVALLVGCGSLLNELERIRARSTPTPGQQSAPYVVSTDPADNSIGPYNQTYIDVIYSEQVETGTVSAQPNFGACTGTLQISYDGFINCMGGSLDSSGNPRIRFTPVVFPKGLGFQIRTLADIKGVSGISATPYQSAVGFRLGAPCGNFNCFFSYSTPLMQPAGTASHIFLIRNGMHKGKYIAYSAGGTQTTMIDPTAASSEAGPDLAPCFTPGPGTLSFYVATGPLGGSQVILQGNNTTGTCVYDPTGHVFTTVGAPSLGGMTIGAGAYSIQPSSGNDAGNTIILRGNSQPDILRYTPGGNITDTGLDIPGSLAIGGHAIPIVTGSSTGQYFHVTGGNTGSYAFYEPSTPGVFTGSTASGNVNDGSFSFEVFTGSRAGQIITALANNGNLTSVVTTASFGLGAPGPTLSFNHGPGGLLLRQANTASFDEPLVLHGTAAGTATSKYVASSGMFATGPTTTGITSAGSSAVYMPGTSGKGAFFVINGATISTSVYLPETNEFSGTRLPTTIPGAGGNSAYQVSGGQYDGQTLIVGGMSTSETALFNPLTFTIKRGPNLTMNAQSSTFGVKIEQGSQAGKILLMIAGASANFNVFDPATGFFSVPGGWPTSGSFTAKGLGSVGFTVVGDPRIILMNGTGATSQIIDQSTGGVAVGPTANCSLNVTGFAMRFRKISTGEYRTLVFCQTNFFDIFDHATFSFMGAINSTANAGLGVNAFFIPTGNHAGKVIIVHGNNTLSTSLWNPEDNSVVAGPNMPSVCGAAGVGAGSQVLELQSGLNKNKTLIVTGNGQATTCMYDPNTHSFSQGPMVGNAPSPGYNITAGALAFRTNGGLYPTAFILLSGSTKNVWSAYVP